MDNPNLKYIRLAGLFGLALLLFSYPLLSLFNASRPLGGIPLLYLYLFSAWAALIVLAWIITRFTKPDQAPQPPDRT